MNILKKFWPFLVLAILSFALHFAFLSYPSQVVFDETHFGKFVEAYFTGQYYFDIHPPLGKLLIAGFAKISGLNPSSFSFDHIGQSGPAGLFFVLRFLPALFGSLFTLALAWFAWLLTRSKKTALIAGFLVLCDNAFLVQSRFILVDIFLLFFEITAFCFFLLGLRQKFFSKKWFAYFALTGLFFGLTISVKWTGLAILGIFGAILLTKIFSQKLRDHLEISSSVIPAPQNAGGIHPAVAGRLKAGMTKKVTETILAFSIILIIGFIIYLVPFAIHFKLLPLSGPGDAFMSATFQQELKNPNEQNKLGLWSKFTELNVTMWKANSGLTQTHPFGSRWFEWPFDQKSIFYWNQEANGQNYKVFFSGNLFLWLANFLAVLATLAFSFFKKFRSQLSRFLPIFFVLILSYLANLLPFILIKRVSFLYHYLPALTYALVLLAVWLAGLWPKQKIFLAVILAVILINFILFLPLTFGWPAV